MDDEDFVLFGASPRPAGMSALRHPASNYRLPYSPYSSSSTAATSSPMPFGMGRYARTPQSRLPALDDGLSLDICTVGGLSSASSAGTALHSSAAGSSSSASQHRAASTPQQHPTYRSYFGHARSGSGGGLGLDSAMNDISPAPKMPSTMGAAAAAAGTASLFAATPNPKSHVEEITVERELPFVTPQKHAGLPAASSPAATLYPFHAHGGRATPAAQATTPATAASFASPQPQQQQQQQTSGSGSSGNAADPSQRYATALRTLQESPGSPLKEHNNNNHLFQRRFELTAALDGQCVITRVPAADADAALSAAGSSDASDDAAPSTAATRRPPPKKVFSCGKEISALVNVGDAALCRMITVRTAFSSERDTHAVFLDVTRTLADQVARQLACDTAHDPSAAVKPSTDDDGDGGGGMLEAHDSSQQEEDSGDDETVSPLAEHDRDMYVCGKEVLRSSDGSAQALVQDALQAAAYCSTEQRTRVAGLLEHLSSEAAVTTAAASPSSASSTTRVPVDDVMAQAEALSHREAEARAAGNINLGVAAKRELMALLHTSVKGLVGELEAASLASHAPVVNRRATDDGVAAAVVFASEAAIVARSSVESAATLADKAQARVRLAAQQREALTDDTLKFLGSNANDVSRVLGDIDALHEKLEALVHQRNARLKAFVQTLAVEELHVASLRREHASHGRAAASAGKQLEQAQHLVKACGSIQDAVAPFRASLEARNDALLRERQQRLASVATSGSQLAAMLYHQVTSWIEVLLKNSAREADRMASLHSSVQDAMQRYHQADKELCEQQLQDCATRKRTVDAEVQALEEMLKGLALHDKTFAGCIGAAIGIAPSAAAAGTTAHALHPHRHAPSGALMSYDTPEKRRPLAGEVQTPAPPTTLVLVDETRDSDPTDGSALAHIDTLSVAEFIPLFKKNPATTKKWIELLHAKDVETLGDLRDVRCTAMWETFLQGQPLLKAQLEVLMDNPQRFC